MMTYVLDRKRNIVGKGKNAGYQHFLLFSQCFQTTSFPKSLKRGICDPLYKACYHHGSIKIPVCLDNRLHQ